MGIRKLSLNTYAITDTDLLLYKFEQNLGSMHFFVGKFFVIMSSKSENETRWSRDLLFTGPEKLYQYKKRLGERDKGREATRTLLERDQTYQLHKPARKRFLRRKVVVSGPNEMVDADLLDLIDVKGQNYKQRYLLTVVDVFSKKAYAQPLSSKEASKTATAFEKVLRENKDTLHPRSVRTDHGSEFKSHFNKLLTAKGIKHIWTSSPEIKANYVERFHRTFRDKLRRYMTFSKNSNWTRIFQKLIDSYNETPHSTLKNVAPNDVNESNAAQLFDAMYGSYFLAAADEKFAKLTGQKKYKFKEGHVVRVAIFKKGFSKASQQTYTDELYTVDKVLDTFPTTYQLRDLSGERIMGAYYDNELQLAEPDALAHRRIETVSNKPNKEGLYHVHFKNWPEKYDLHLNSEELSDLIKKQ